MRNKQNKTISVNSKGMVISYTDSNKHMFVNFENQDVPRTMPAKYQEIEQSAFNQKQQKVYSEAVYGLNFYPEVMVSKMPKKIVMKIATRCEMVQKAINMLKQDIVNSKVDSLLLALFPNSPLVKSIVDMEADETIKCNFAFKDLGLNQTKIAEKLVVLKLLPENFFDLQ